MIGIEIVKDKESGLPDSATRDQIVDRCFERGVLFLGCGETSIRISPPLTISREEAAIAMDVLEQCVAEHC